MIKAVINVEAPRPQVFTVLSGFADYVKWLPNCERSTITASNGGTIDTEIVVNTMKKMTLGLRFEPQPTQLLSFRMISGKDIKAYSGSYRLMDSADGSGTVVIAELELDAGPMAPKFLVDRMTKKALDDTGTALRKYIKTLPAQAPSATPAAAPSAGTAPAPSKPRRRRLVMKVVKTAEGQKVWYMGQTLVIKS